MAVQVTRQDLTAKVQEGWKKKALAEHYGLPVMQMTQLLKDANLTIRKFHAPKYILIDEVAEVAQDATVANEMVQDMVLATMETPHEHLAVEQIEAVSEVVETPNPIQGW